MIIQTRQSRLAAFIDIVLTALAWIAFVYFFGQGVLDIVSGSRANGPDAPILHHFLPAVGTLGVYAVVALVNAAVLILWAWYNFLRFRGMDRRQAPLPLTDAQLAQSFGLALEQRQGSAVAKSMTIHHSKEGRIEGIDIHARLPH